MSTGTGIMGHNMFAYCNNNPVVMSDFSGDYPTYSGTLYDGGTFSHVPAHRLGYLGQIKKYWQDTNEDFSITTRVEKDDKRPNGPPNSQTFIYNENGTVKQVRWYDAYGKALRDRDFNHSGNYDFPHDHTWSKDGRSKTHSQPDPSFEVDWDLAYKNSLSSSFYSFDIDRTTDDLSDITSTSVAVVMLVIGCVYMMSTGDPTLIQQNVFN